MAALLHTQVRKESSHQSTEAEILTYAQSLEHQFAESINSH
jgi:hypothetical protein